MRLIEGTAQGRAAVAAGAETHTLSWVCHVGLSRKVCVAQVANIDEKIKGSGFAGEWMDGHGFTLVFEKSFGILCGFSASTIIEHA
jgi:hypothetical protein